MSLPPLDDADVEVYDVAMRTRFRGIERRQGLLVRGPAGWGEWSPFLDYSGAELVPWWRACREAAGTGFPAPVRDRVPVNCTVPALDPEPASALVAGSGCRTAKVKVAEPGQTLAEDVARVGAVRDALGPDGAVRVDANGAWDVDGAERAIGLLRRYGLEYVEQPCARTEELAELRRRLARRGWDVPVAADESIRRSGDPERVVALEAADVVVLKVQPLGGVAACLELAERLGLPVVVSSALETSVGIAAGLALAAALPELPFACGLNTVPLLTDDVVDHPLRAVDGEIVLRDVRPSAERLAAVRADEATRERWLDRLRATRELDAAGSRR
ncbi:o-succinylbenzoate synthase [Auraticoccus monumenti]|uniref:o-succinylbenzoate synthase n=1 Tax=Auraticoccus monumenti TaxID=675864 RepID=A0A1G6WR43_9ACTN|nr:o-succinylbenzoate synthase [Auraticoccus monumenti]SDD68291.1 O-succinylbenzoate synthase [Auraticoccus monumenti]